MRKQQRNVIITSLHVHNDTSVEYKCTLTKEKYTCISQRATQYANKLCKLGVEVSEITIGGIEKLE